jgi:hypothetical protein
MTRPGCDRDDPAWPPPITPELVDRLKEQAKHERTKALRDAGGWIRRVCIRALLRLVRHSSGAFDRKKFGFWH